MIAKVLRFWISSFQIMGMVFKRARLGKKSAEGFFE